MDKNEMADHQGLLQDEESFLSQQMHRQEQTETSQRQFWHILALYISNILCLAALVWSLARPNLQDPTLEIYSPANHVIEYEDVVFYNGIQEWSPYQQLPPDDVVDELWNRLYRHTLPDRIDRESSRKLVNQTVVAPGSDGEGLIGLEMFHGLHCLNALRKSLWPSRYPDYSVIFANGSRNDFMTTHHNHCIDRLRMNLMCAGNVGTIYWMWNQTMSPPRWMINMETTHKCRNFDKILEWAVSHEYTGWDDHTPSRATNS